MEKIKFQSEDGIIEFFVEEQTTVCLLYTSPSPRD